MKFTLTIVTALAALTPDAAAAPCATFTQARASHRTQYLVYRLEHRKPGDRKCWYAPAKSFRGGVESKAVRGWSRRPLEHASRSIPPSDGPSGDTGWNALAGIAQAVKSAQPTAGYSRRIPEQPEAAHTTDGQVAGLAPGPRDRIDSTFTTINYFTTMPWHDDLWLRIQVYWLRENGAFGVPVWVMSARWP